MTAFRSTTPRRCLPLRRPRHFRTELLLTLTACIVFAVTNAGLAAGPRQRLSMDTGWRFHLGDMAGFSSIPEGTPVDHWRWKPDEQGDADAARMAAPNLDTSGVDWSDATPGQDVFHGRRGFSWFRAQLKDIPGPNRNVYFAGVDDNATVYLNGQKLTVHQGWDDPFQVRLDSAWRNGGPNMLAVLVENTDGPGGISKTILFRNQSRVKSGSAAGADFNDRDWRVVNVPHDFVVEGTFAQNASASHGYLPTGVGWYRRTFVLPKSYKGKRLWIEFDGVYRNSSVWLNGHLLGTHQSGYTSFYYDVTDIAVYGGRNVLAVRADASKYEGWWYEGGGIYRHVWFSVLDPIHVDHWGTYVTSTVPDVGDGQWADATVTVQTTLVNESPHRQACTVRTDIQDADGRVVGSVRSSADVAAGAHCEVKQEVKLTGAHLWSVEDPHLYRAVTTIGTSGKTCDQVVTPFGIRTIRFDPDKGFFLNGKSLKIQGTCNHQDFAGVGVALPDAIQTYKIKRLKEMGANGYRCSHHPPTPELLDACDRLGMVVMDENRHLGDSPEILDQVRSMVLRDRNHPSVIMWSLCNEERLQGTEQGQEMGAAMKAVIERFDSTRPVTAAMNGGYGSGLSNVVDLQGFNYHIEQYDKFHKSHPKQPCIGSESASILTTRGIYVTDPVRAYVSSYTDGAERTWRPVAERAFMAGSFIWTGFDYRGEPTPYNWPCINSHFGAMDTCGFPKDDYYYYQSWWGTKPVLHLAPHWNWANRPGRGSDILVRCCSNCDRVELFLNGKSLGTQEMQPCSHLEWKVPWEPGVLSAKGFRGGKEIISTKVETTGDPTTVQLTPDRSTIKADGEDVALVTVSLLDAQGRLVPTADNEVYFTVSPNARIIGVGNGDPSCHEPDKASQRRAFNGLCMVIVQSTIKSGPITLKARSDRLKSAEITIQAEKVALRPSLPAM